MYTADLLTSQQVDWDCLEAEVKGDSGLEKMRQELQEGKLIAGFSLAGHRLVNKGRMVLPKTSHVIPLLLKEYHDSPTGGHAGEVKTYLRLTSEWFWQGMRKTVAKYVRECVVCQQNKHSQQQIATSAHTLSHMGGDLHGFH